MKIIITPPGLLGGMNELTPVKYLEQLQLIVSILSMSAITSISAHCAFSSPQALAIYL
jgi:hypothetical protein